MSVHVLNCLHARLLYIIAVISSVLLLLIINRFVQRQCLQCFDAVGWAAGKATGL